MFRNFFKRIPKKFLGVDIGTSSIKIIELGRGKKKPKLENYGELSISLFEEKKEFRVFEESTLLLSEKEVAEAINIICKEAGIETKEVNFSIPDFSTFFTTIEIPPMQKEEVSQAVKYEVRPYIPLPLSELYIDWTILEGKFGKTNLKILVVAIPNDVISQYKEIAAVSGLKLKVMEPEVFALARTLSDKEKNKRVQAIVDIGARTTTCSVLDEGILKTSHSFNIAGNELTEILAKSLNISYNKARKLKEVQGLTGEVRFWGKSTKEILLPLIDSILDEIKKVFRDFYREQGKEVEKVILSGGIALMPGIKEYFSSELKKKVEIINPFLGIVFPPILEEILKERGPVYAVAVGAALKGFE